MSIAKAETGFPFLLFYLFDPVLFNSLPKNCNWVPMVQLLIQKRWAAVLPSSLRICALTKQPSQYVFNISSISFMIDNLFTQSPLIKLPFHHFTTCLFFIPTIVILSKDILMSKRFVNSRFTKTKEEIICSMNFWASVLSWPILQCL